MVENKYLQEAPLNLVLLQIIKTKVAETFEWYEAKFREADPKHTVNDVLCDFEACCEDTVSENTPKEKEEEVDNIFG